MGPAGVAANFPAANQTYRVYPFFQGYDGDCAGPVPYLLPPSYSAGQASEAELPLLFVGGSAQLGNGYANTDFSLAFSASGKGPVNQATVTAKVTAGTAIWSCAPAARAALQASFLDFLAGVETLEGGALLAGGTRRIALALADLIPAAPVETLFFRYGLSTGLAPGALPFVDVVPGMRLRVQAQASQYLAPGSPENGYLPGGELRAEVGSVAGAQDGSPRLVSFDPFLATIRAPLVSGPATTPTIVGGLVDLDPAGGARPHWRLFAPQQVCSPSEAGELTAGANPTLVGAPTYAALQAATASYPAAAPNEPGLLYAIVLGRALIVPEIPVWITVRGLTTIEHVAVGTTLANVIERYQTLPLDPSQWANEVTLTRATTATTSGTAPLSIYSSGLYALTPELFDVPLIAGDSVSLPS